MPTTTNRSNLNPLFSPHSLFVDSPYQRQASTVSRYIYIWWFPFEFYEPREKHKLKFIEPNWRWSRNWLKKCYFSEYTTFYCRLSYINLATHTAHTYASKIVHAYVPSVSSIASDQHILYVSMNDILSQIHNIVAAVYESARAVFIYSVCIRIFGFRSSSCELMFVICTHSPETVDVSLDFFFPNMLHWIDKILSCNI